MALLSILSKDEIESLYSIPKLDDEERSFLFELDKKDKTYLSTLGKDTPRKINYILQLGYYRAVNCFFQSSFIKQKADVQYILKTYFSGESFPRKQISKNYHYLNRKSISKRLTKV